jgi:hypothetical protein
VPHDRSYVSPTFTADRARLHLEARYNYEDKETGSLWVGYDFSVGRKLVLEATPMVGAVFGNTRGIAPGYQISLTRDKLALSTTGEFVFDLHNGDKSFFYTWTELSYSPLEWLRAGVVAQRTKAYHTGLDIQRGLLVGFSHKRAELTAYVFNFG